MGLDILGYNHTDRSIYKLRPSMSMAAATWSTHRWWKITCCMSIPCAYKPGMTVTVWWSDWGGENAMERVVEVPRYGPDEGGTFCRYFLRGGEESRCSSP